MSKPTPEDQIEFLVKIQRLFSEGSFVATYKFALLQALADLSVEKGDYSGEALPIKTREIAAKFIQYYARQSLPFPSQKGANKVIRQNTTGQALVISRLIPLVYAQGISTANLRKNKDEWLQLVNTVSRKIKEDPLWRLQKLGNEYDDFLYENPCEYTNIDEITLKPGVAYNFRMFHGLIQDLIRGAWVRHIRSIGSNDNILGESKDLQEFLFGSERESLDVYRDFLMDMQDGECFYCKGNIRGPGDVDHFIPWVKYPVDLGHNFVLTDSNCNRKKRDYLAAENHLENWFNRNHQRQKALEEFFDEKSVFHNLESSNQITCWAYEQAENTKAHVWMRGDEVRPVGTYWRNLFWEEVTIEELAADKPE